MAYMNPNDDFMDRKMANKPANAFYDPNANFYSPNQSQQGMAPPGAAQPNQFGYSDWSAQYYNPNMMANDPYGGGAGGFSVPSGHIGQKVPVADFAAGGVGPTSVDEFENEPPLLEELGINFKHIYRKTVCVLNPFAKPHESIINDEDLAGPLVFCIAYGFSLLLMGKIQFGYRHILHIMILKFLSCLNQMLLSCIQILLQIFTVSTTINCFVPRLIILIWSFVFKAMCMALRHWAACPCTCY
jgi:hypothetical protein